MKFDTLVSRSVGHLSFACSALASLRIGMLGWRPSTTKKCFIGGSEDSQVARLIFHNGSAASLADVLVFYDMRFNIGLLPRRKPV
jgi:hypothetical protein